MTAHWTRVATANLPESRKPGLLPNVQRARAALALMERDHISLLAAQESGTFLAQACAGHPYLSIVRATPNENRNGRERGNVVVFDAREWRVSRNDNGSRAVKDLRLTIPAGKPPRFSKTETRPINQARVRFTHLPTDQQVRVWSVHKPRDLRGYQHARGRLDGLMEAHAEWWDDTEQIAILLGDFNGAPPNLVGMRRRASSGPDNIVATADLEWRGKQYHPLKPTKRGDRTPRISDHAAAVSIELGIPERRHGLRVA